MEDLSRRDLLKLGAAATLTASLGVGESLALRRLKGRAVIREAAPGTFYLDEGVWTAVRRTRMRMALTFIAIMAVLLLGILVGIIKP